MHRLAPAALVVALTALLGACGEDVSFQNGIISGNTTPVSTPSTPTGDTDTGTGTDADGDTDDGDVPAVFAKFASGVTVYRDGDEIVIESTAVPNHGSPYFPVGDPRYEAYNGTNPDWNQNPSTISTQSLVFRIPVTPQEAATKQSTPMGPMGVSLNGVPFFNQYAAGGVALGPEINSFDQYLGHPQNTGMYHYHQEPVYLTSTEGEDGLLGFLLDGYPVYGPTENGAAVTNAMLDAYHGHTAVTVDYPDGIYHYHVTDADPYINGSGFFGVPGTVSQ
jgi:hypothetical protein